MLYLVRTSGPAYYQWSCLLTHCCATPGLAIGATSSVVDGRQLVTTFGLFGLVSLIINRIYTM